MAEPAPTRRVVLLALDWLRTKDPRVSLGHASLLARLAAESTVQVVPMSRAVNAQDFDRRRLLSDLLDALGSSRSDLAIGVYVWNDAVVRWLLPELRQGGYNGRVILGGPQISYAGIGIQELYPDAQVFVRGYGEDALAAALTSDMPATIPGVVLQGSSDSTQVADVGLDRLPSPLLRGVLPLSPFMRWETQRGCMYRCSFCQHREAGARLQRNELASARIAAELDAMVGGGVRDIAVLDPIFNANPDATAILERFAARGYQGRLSLQGRFEMLSPSFLDACAAIPDVVLEFGLQTIHETEMRACRRRNNIPRVEAAIGALHDRGISFEVSLIYGLPTQTLRSFQETVRWCQDRGVPTLKAFPLMLLRGTELHQHRARWRLVESDDVIPVVVESDSFCRAEWEQMRALAEGLGRSTSAEAVAA